MRNVEYVRDVMKAVGLEPERISMHFCSAAEGQKFQTTVIELAKIIKKLGPSPLRGLAADTKKKSAKKTAPSQTSK